MFYSFLYKTVAYLKRFKHAGIFGHECINVMYAIEKQAHEINVAMQS